MTQPIPFRRIGICEAQDLLSRDDIIILDVRDADSYRRGHIEDAQNVSMSNLSMVLQTAPKSAPVLIYCYHGNASQEYARIFSDFRFQEVYSLDDGYEGWTTRARA